MAVEHVNGKKKGRVMLYALSTCSWCARTKDLLRELGVDFDYTYVDLLEGKEQDDTMNEVEKWNPKGSFPTLVIRDKKGIIGFREDEIPGGTGIMNLIAIDEKDVDRTYPILKKEAESGGYFLNPDVDFTKNLVRGLLKNEQRYGYRACPCRLASGKKEEDLDIICPCIYRDPDVTDFDSCYCALYVSEAVTRGKMLSGPVPERRPPRSERVKKGAMGTLPKSPPLDSLPFPIWRCMVCGYLCAREQPPEICPICKVKKERFERFI